jgi:hypothetical protein
MDARIYSACAVNIANSNLFIGLSSFISSSPNIEGKYSLIFAFSVAIMIDSASSGLIFHNWDEILT